MSHSSGDYIGTLNKSPSCPVIHMYIANVHLKKRFVSISYVCDDAVSFYSIMETIIYVLIMMIIT